MTIDQFLRQLRRVSHLRGWFINSSGQLRRSCAGELITECPITAVANYRRGRRFVYALGGFDRAARYLGLSGKQAITVIDAADAEPTRPLRKNSLRRRMEKIVGLR